MEKELIQRLHKLQHTSVGKALRILFKKSDPKHKGTQTSYMSYEEEIKQLREDMDSLYKDKYVLKLEADTAKREVYNLRKQLQQANSELSEVKKENKLLGQTMQGGQTVRKFDSSQFDHDEIVSLNRKIDQYKDIIKKRDQQIKNMIDETKDLKDQKNTVISRLNVKLYYLQYRN